MNANQLATMAPLTLRLFGSFAVNMHGVPLPRLRTRKGEWLLALLVLRAAPVDRAWLAGTLWPDSPERLALRSLRTALADLRHALGAEAHRLHAPTPRTLAFDVAGADVDLLAFDAATARGDPPSLAAAVALYRGTLLEGCYEPWALQERETREQAFLGALEALATSAMAAGEPAAAEQHLRRAVGVEPLRESAHRGLMAAQASAGSLTAALATYRELRLLLHHEIGGAPAPETTALYASIRDQAQGHGRFGNRLRPSPPSLPMPPTRLLGREQEAAAVCTRLGSEETRLVTLSGPPGTGKTRLAIEVAHGLVDEFADGVFFISLASIRDPTLVTSAIALSVGIRESGERSMVDGLKQSLRSQQILLVLDNFEHLLSAAPLVAELLAAAPELRILATSRAVLRLQGELEFSVPPLPVPAPSQTLSLPELATYAAVSLFEQRAVSARSDFALTAANAPSVVEICRRLDGLPLAIELAAARIRLFSPETLLSRLDSRLSLLTGGPRDLPARQQTLRDAIAWSYDLLPEAEQRLFRRLSIFVDGCTLEAAEAVSGDEEALGTVVETLSTLVEWHLVQREEWEGEARFTLLETLREFGQERLAASEEEHSLRRSHAQFFLEWLAQGEGVKDRVWTPISARRLEQELGNLRAALIWAAERNEAESGLRGAYAAWPLWHAGGYVVEGRRWFTELLALPSAHRCPMARDVALREAGALACVQGDYAAAQRLFEESLAIWAGQSDRKGPVADALLGLGRCSMANGNFVRAQSYLEEALTTFRELESRCEMADTLGLLGSVLRLQEDYDRAAEIYEESRAFYERLGKREGLVARELRNLGHVAQFRGEVGRAKSLFRQSLSVLNETGNRLTIPGCLVGMAGVVAAEGEPTRGARLLGAAQGLIEAMDAVWEPAERAEYERHWNAVVAQLGEAAFAASDAGRLLSLDEAIAVALGDGP